MESEDRNIVNSAIYGGNPLKSYIKTILGKVYVTVWDSFESIPEGLILYGDPRAFEDTCIVDVWTEEEDFYFRNKNKRHLQTGDIIEYTKKSEPKKRQVEEYSDDELKKILSSPFFTLQNTLNGTDSIALLFRIKGLAESMEKSEKIIKIIDARVSEVQASEYTQMPKVITTEL